MYYTISIFKTTCSEYSNSNISSISKCKHLDLDRVWDFYIIMMKISYKFSCWTHVSNLIIVLDNQVIKYQSQYL